MWSLERLRWLRLLAAGAAVLSVAACFRPLLGPTASGEPMQEALASIDVPPIPVGAGQERVSHYLRNELLFELNGTGEPRAKRYRLDIKVSESLQTPIVDSATGRALSATLAIYADYTLTAVDGGALVVSGVESVQSTYDRSAQRFANVRAARDAQIRSSKDLARLIRLRIAAAFATRGT